MSLPTPTVNLLPWRPQLRRQRCRTFNVLLLGLLVTVVLLNAGAVVVMGHHAQTLGVANEGLNQQLDQVLAARDALTEALPEFEAGQHWVDSGQWLDELASTTPEGVRWRALQWYQSRDHWQLQFEASEMATVAAWASAWEANIEVSAQQAQGLTEAVMVGQLSSLLALHSEHDNALVD